MKKVSAATSLLALSWAYGALALTPAFAQTSGAPTAEAASPDDEIVVTAQRRSERLVDVPLSVASVSSELLEQAGGESIENLNKLVPGVYMQRDVYGLSPTIRGIGSTLTSSGGEPNIPVYIDGVFVPFKATNFFDLSSISNIQVLKGPQGTLFGRNATGGALLLTTLDPSFDPEARFRVSYNDLGTARANAYGNMPLSNQTAVNLAASYRDSEGYIRDILTNEIANEGYDWSARGKFLWQVNADVDVVLTAYHSTFDDPTGSSYQAVQMAPLIETLNALNGLPIARDRDHVSHSRDGVVETESDQYSLNISWETGIGAFRSITSSQSSSLHSINDLDVSEVALLDLDFRTEAEVLTQELNLTSTSRTNFDYVAGLYYYRNESGAPSYILTGVPQFTISGKAEAISAYADVSYHLGDWVLIGGIRFTHEDREVTTNFIANPQPPRHQETSEDVWTPRVGVRYELSDDSNVYAMYTRGYKAGIFDATNPASTPVDPEFVDAFEIGYKTQSDNFTLNTAAYFYDFTDAQVNSFVISLGSLVNVTLNAPAAEIYGAEIDGSYRFNESWDIRGAVAYTHARYTDFPNAPNYVATGGPFSLMTPVQQDVAGNHMVRAPDWTANAAINYHTDLGGPRLDVTLGAAYSSEVFFDFANERSQDAYVLWDTRASLTFENLEVAIFGQNLTDEVYKRSSGYSIVGTAQTFGAPRVWGVSIGYTF
ncbi:MAG: TonB-dependent receptor [Hydrogenophilaceae bacterium]|jgi:iron complex outermembrane receptor protein|nr:TonB-dependent receptor [Hydrogenophilaceae bacterium]